MHQLTKWNANTGLPKNQQENGLWNAIKEPNEHGTKSVVTTQTRLLLSEIRAIEGYCTEPQVHSIFLRLSHIQIVFHYSNLETCFQTVC